MASPPRRRSPDRRVQGSPGRDFADEGSPRRRSNGSTSSGKKQYLHNQIKEAEEESGMHTAIWDNPYRSGTPQWHVAEQNRSKSLRDDTVGGGGYSKRPISQLNENIMLQTHEELKSKLQLLTEENIGVRLRLQAAIDERDAFRKQLQEIKQAKESVQTPKSVNKTTEALKQRLIELRAEHDEDVKMISQLEKEREENTLLQKEVQKLVRENIGLKDGLEQLQIQLKQKAVRLETLSRLEETYNLEERRRMDAIRQQYQTTSAEQRGH
eukprot:gnl/Hemi2/17961_TR5931_c0_g1_i1.p1 gnl/Hemi2/17961_TR5931_c0_g1~~gnl/Hemi2/17961_TR5931_c0_g1_i1.p1  ORF type:complete len:268 (-),score=44.72 gnl/Hemi2/17961_TR5931_c0_g1_i1:182-985(-)